jgi:NADH dehydrogenase FAD-containing subunit
MDKKIVIVGAGVAGVNAATKLVDNGYPGSNITIIDRVFRSRWLE